jgi:hypothetical protein
MTARMLFRTSGRVTVVQQGAHAAHDDEWMAFLKDLSKRDLSKHRVLIFSAGGGPTASQRVPLKALMAGRSMRTAVVSDSIKVRFIIATIALINSEHHGYTRRELGKAYDFLELTAEERTECTSIAKQLAGLLE